MRFAEFDLEPDESHLDFYGKPMCGAPAMEWTVCTDEQKFVTCETCMETLKRISGDGP